MTQAELDQSIYWEAEQYIPFDIQDVNLDTRFSIRAPGPTRAAAWTCCSSRRRRKRSADYTSVIAQAGRTPVIVDVDAFALQNAYEINYGLTAGQVGGAAQRRRQRHQHQHHRRRPVRLTRDISMGGNAYTEAVQKELDLPFESREQVKKGSPVDGATFEDAQPVLRAVTENVLLEIQKTFDFFKATASSDQIDRIMLSGGASRVDGFRECCRTRSTRRSRTSIRSGR
jgi:type IV pilus assembly protein PilM